MYERFKPWILLSPALLVILVLFVGGLFFGLIRSFNYFPLIGLTEPNLDAYRNILTSNGFLRSLGLTLHIAITSTVISMILAVGTGLVLRENFKGKKVMTFLFQLNLPIPHIVGAIGILFLFTQGGYSAQFPELVFDRFAIGIIAEYVWKEIPFIGVVVLAILQSIGDDYESLAQTLGASKWQRFRYVLLPLILPGILSVSVIVLAFTFGAFEIPFILGQSFPQHLSVLAVRNYTNPDLNARPEAMATAIIIALISTVLIFIYMTLSRRLVRSD
jgi:putative spermidine/putrescine transport system permease protein